MPLAVDTTGQARALVDDGSEQARRSRALLSEKEIFVPDSVLLETEWLLRSVMQLDRTYINGTFATLVASVNISFSNRRAMADVIASHATGLDFADAMHLQASGACEGVASFDKEFKRRAKKIAGAVPILTP
ncbi:MAG: type II toxin-antitoxin system VapC family toxin [Rhizobiaceae bacterium]